jgi:ubiquinone/menaquinone biosynthesis C-methylase UbiE
MELLTVTNPYRDLMRAQVQALALRPGQRIADLGSGTGSLPLYLLEHYAEAGTLRIDEIDYVGEALERARERLATRGAPSGLEVRYLECYLDLPGQDRLVPAEDGAYDRLVASLLLNYVREPASLLKEARRLLRPGGRLVLSTLRRDVDISRIYLDVSSELRSGAALRFLGVADEQLIETDLHGFLNEAARLVDLEEKGIFHFWDAEELVAQLRGAGFAKVEIEVAFGDPPQAIVASAVRS